MRNKNLNGGMEMENEIAQKVEMENCTAPDLAICGEPVYMCVETGGVDVKSGWNYENQDGKMVNAVDLQEVEEVVWDYSQNYWREWEVRDQK